MASAAQHAQSPLSLLASGGVCDLSKRSYFHVSMLASLAFTFVNRPADCMFFELEINLVAGIPSWPANVRWVGTGSAPQNLQTGKIHKFLFTRPQSIGADQWLGSYLPNF